MKFTFVSVRHAKHALHGDVSGGSWGLAAVPTAVPFMYPCKLTTWRRPGGDPSGAWPVMGPVGVVAVRLPLLRWVDSASGELAPPAPERVVRVRRDRTESSMLYRNPTNRDESNASSSCSSSNMAAALCTPRVCRMGVNGFVFGTTW